MKFLLVAINAKFLHSNPAVYSLKAYAGDQYGENIEIAEFTINHNIDAILANIYLRKPDVIGFSCYIWNRELVEKVVIELAKILPNVPIWLGGPEVSYDAKKQLENKEITGIMVGEGEETFKELLEYYMHLKSDHLKDIKGIVLRDEITQKRELMDLSKVPFLYHNMKPFENRIVYYESSRGCPYNCSYCLSSIDKKVRLRDFEIVKQELQFFLDLKLSQVKFIDRTFNCNKNHAIKILKYILEHDNGITNFHFEVAGDILGQEELTLFSQMRKGLIQLEIGVQSTNIQTLKEIDRVTNLEQLKINVATIRNEKNIHQHLDLIAGLPFEPYESFKESFNEVYAMKPNQLQLGFLKVLKGSKMHDKAEEYGLIYQDNAPYEVLYTKWITYEEIIKLKKIEEVLELYYNSNQFVYTLFYLVNSFQSPFQMYELLSLFYEEKGYEFASSKRVYRYQILFEFACKYDLDNIEIYKELLTFDLYLRENMKNRPEFSKDQSLYKEIAKQFYMKENENPQFLKDYEQYDQKQMSRMTHFEVFKYPVFLQNLREIKEEKEVAIVFDYQKRDPLTYEASYSVVPI